MTILQIDRSKKFEIADHVLGPQWSVVEEDERSLALTEVDLSKIRFETMLQPNESWITAEEQLKRLKAKGSIRLDAMVLMTLVKSGHLVPASWKKEEKVSFSGTILKGPSGAHRVLCLCWSGLDDRWSFCPITFRRRCSAGYRSAVLVS